MLTLMVPQCADCTELGAGGAEPEVLGCVPGEWQDAPVVLAADLLRGKSAHITHPSGGDRLSDSD
jgi:hypothetical protein